MIKELIHTLIFLAGKSEPATKKDLFVAQDLLDTLIAHKDICVGLPANIISVKKYIIALLDESGQTPNNVKLNPEITKKDGAYNTVERCFSLLGGPRLCKRHKSIKIKYQNLELQTRIKTYTGWTAQIIQHEVDHCEDKLI